MLRNLSTGARMSTRVRRARLPWTRSLGWLYRRRVAIDEGLWFDRCNAVHTIGMRTPIDVLLLDGDHRVLATESRIGPGLVYVSFEGTQTIVEMGPGFLDVHEVRAGDKLGLE
jgi:uncharacterized membrane protein (UPF0127 family)